MFTTAEFYLNLQILTPFRGFAAGTVMWAIGVFALAMSGA
jgi:hypothetical protein